MPGWILTHACTELHRDKGVSDDSYFGAVAQFGEAGVVDLIGASGYYTLISMCLNLNQKSAPTGVAPLLRAIDVDKPLKPRGAEERPPLSDLQETQMSDAQLTLYRELSANGKALSTPMRILIRSPELAKRAQKVSEYLRFEAQLPAQITQFGIAITATYWKAATMWRSHSAEAIKLGLSANTMTDLEQGRRPSGMTEDQAAAYDFCMQLHSERKVSDAAFEAAINRFGDRRIVEMVGVCGYYTLAAMALKVGRKAP